MNTAAKTARHTPVARRVVLTGGALAAFLTVGHTAIDIFSSMITALLPLIQARFRLTETILAFLVATLAFSSSLIQPLVGALADRLGRRRVGALGLILTAALLSLVGVAPTTPVLWGLLLVGGLGSAAFHPVGASIARTAGGRHAGLAVGLFTTGGTIGVALGPVIALALVSTVGRGATPWLMLPAVVMGLLMLVVVPPQERAPRKARSRLVDARLVAGPVGLLALTGIFGSVAFITFTSAVPLWLVTARGVARDAPLIGWTLTAFSLAAALGGDRRGGARRPRAAPDAHPRCHAAGAGAAARALLPAPWHAPLFPGGRAGRRPDQCRRAPAGRERAGPRAARRGRGVGDADGLQRRRRRGALSRHRAAAGTHRVGPGDAPRVPDPDPRGGGGLGRLDPLPRCGGRDREDPDHGAHGVALPLPAVRLHALPVRRSTRGPRYPRRRGRRASGCAPWWGASTAPAGQRWRHDPFPAPGRGAARAPGRRPARRAPDRRGVFNVN